MTGDATVGINVATGVGSGVGTERPMAVGLGIVVGQGVDVGRTVGFLIGDWNACSGSDRIVARTNVSIGDRGFLFCAGLAVLPNNILSSIANAASTAITKIVLDPVKRLFIRFPLSM